MFREFDEGPSTTAPVSRSRHSTGLSQQFESLEAHGVTVSETASTIQELLERLQKNPFVTDCEALLTSLKQRG